MATYVAHRLVQIVPVLLLVTMISFALMFVLPGDPALLILGDQVADREAYETLRTRLQLDRPLPLQYAAWLGKAVRGDLGTSTRDDSPVAGGIAERLPVTLELSALALLFAVSLALPAGIVSAVRPNSRVDVCCSVLSLGGAAVPHFWLGILLIYALGVATRLLPISGYVPFREDPLGNLTHMMMPATALGLGIAAILMRQVRSSLLEALGEDYVVTARAKGLSTAVVIARHALRNALIPVVTVLGLQVGRLFGGAVITETIFSLPGLGRWAVDSILWRDFSVVQAVCLVMALGVLLSNLAADLAYAWIDPRIRYRA